MVDLPVDSRNLRMTALPSVLEKGSNEVEKAPMLRFVNEAAIEMEAKAPHVPQFLPCTQWAHSQIAKKLSIPVHYYERMREEGPDLLTDNVNFWLPKKNGTLVRIMKDRVIAVLGLHYKIIPNLSVAENAAQWFYDYKISGGEVVFKECKLTDTRLYMKVLFPDMEVDVSKPDEPSDVWSTGVIISNTEVGAGALYVSPFFYRQVCTNGLIVYNKQHDFTLRQVHSGKKIEPGLMDWSNRTKKLANEVIWSKMNDILATITNRELLMEQLERIRRLREMKLDSVSTTIDNVVAEFSLPKKVRDSMLEMLEPEDQTMMGVVNAMTRVAQKTEKYDDQIILETKAGDIVQMSDSKLEKLMVVA
jgi:hypothetical protein